MKIPRRGLRAEAEARVTEKKISRRGCYRRDCSQGLRELLHEPGRRRELLQEGLRRLRSHELGDHRGERRGGVRLGELREEGAGHHRVVLLQGAARGGGGGRQARDGQGGGQGGGLVRGGAGRHRGWSWSWGLAACSGAG